MTHALTPKARALVPGFAALLLACNPTVKVEAPTEPITINLNVHIEQEVRIKIEREADKLIKDRGDLF